MVITPQVLQLLPGKGEVEPHCLINSLQLWLFTRMTSTQHLTAYGGDLATQHLAIWVKETQQGLAQDFCQ